MATEPQALGVEARLEQLVERLALLEQQNVRLSREVATLRGTNAGHIPDEATIGHGQAKGELEPSAGRPVSRRGMFRFLGGAAAGVGLAVAGTTIAADPAGATAGTMRFGDTNDAGSDFTVLESNNGNETLYVSNSGDGSGIEGIADDTTFPNSTGMGVYGVAGGTSNLLGSSGTRYGGVVGDTNIQSRPGVRGVSTNGDGVRGIAGSEPNDDGFQDPGGLYLPAGVVGASAYSNAPGVRGVADTGPGIHAFSNQGIGLFVYGGHTTFLLQPTGGFGPPPLSGHQAGELLYGEDGVLWFNRGSVWDPIITGGPNTLGPDGFTVTATGSSPAVHAVGSASGYAVEAQGGKAQLYIVPASTAGAPGSGSHLRGEVFVDSNGVQFVCTSAGTPGTWQQVITGGLNNLGAGSASVSSTAAATLTATAAGSSGQAVHGAITNGANTSPAVFGVTASTGGGAVGVRGQVTAATPGSSACGVFGYCSGSGAAGNGVMGEHNGAGIGVRGFSMHGYGVEAQGGQAQLHLVPASTAGAPTTGAHSLGELFVDKVGALFLCTTAGSPGTWKTVQVV